MPSHVFSTIVLVLWHMDPNGRNQVYLVQRPLEEPFFAGFWGFMQARMPDVLATNLAFFEVLASCPPATWANLAIHTDPFLATSVWNLPHAQLQQLGLSPNVAMDPVRLQQTLDKHQLGLSSQSCSHVGTWQTPPCIPHAHNTHYVALALAQNHPCLSHGSLSTKIPWVLPSVALENHHLNQRYLDYPTLQILDVLAANEPFEKSASQIQRCIEHDPKQHKALAHGIRMQPLPSYTLPPSTHTNCYVLGQQELVVVDPGTPHAEAQAELILWLTSLCQQGAKISEIWITHAHPDHTGAVAALQKHFNISVAAHRDTADFLHQQNQINIGRTLKDNQVTHLAGDHCWQALWTPGHAPGHLSFYDPKRHHLLSGDNVLGLGTSLVPPSPSGDMQAYMQSLDRILKLPLGLLLPGHGPQIAQAKAAVSRVHAHRLAREQQIFSAVTHGPETLETLLEHIYPGIEPAARPLAQMNLLAHLEKLVREKRVVQMGTTFQKRG